MGDEFASTFQSNQITIDPSYFSNTRCEFRLPKEMVFDPKAIRLVGIGAESTASGVGQRLNEGAGLLASIQKMTILSGGTELDSIDEFAVWATFHGRFGDEVDVRARSKYTKNQMGWNRVITSYGNRETMQPWTLGFFPKGNDLNVREDKSIHIAQQFFANMEFATCYLHEYLPLLRNMDFLRTRNRDIRIVLQFTPPGTKFTVFDDEVQKQHRPSLNLVSIVDNPEQSTPFTSLMNPANERLETFTFEGFELEKIQIASVPKGEQTIQLLRPRAFNNKFLTRFVSMDLGLDRNVNQSQVSPIGQTKDQFNLLVAGKRMVPFNVRCGSQSLSRLEDAWGDMSFPALLNVCPLDQETEMFPLPDDWSGDNGYKGLSVNFKVPPRDGLELLYVRNPPSDADDKYAGPLSVYIYGGVMKRLTWLPTGGAYMEYL